MAYLRLKRSLRVVLAATFATIGCAHAQTNSSCDPAKVAVQDARLVIVPDFDGRSAQLTLQGRFDPAKIPTPSATALCSATLGQALKVNGAVACSAFAKGSFSGQDHIAHYDDGVEFRLSRAVNQWQSDVSISLDGNTCADLVVEVQPGQHHEFDSVSGAVPQYLDKDHIEFELKSDEHFDKLNVKMATRDLQPNAKDKHGPSDVERVLQALILSLTIVSLFSCLESRYALAEKPSYVWRHARMPITVAMAFYWASVLPRIADHIVLWAVPKGSAQAIKPEAFALSACLFILMWVLDRVLRKVPWTGAVAGGVGAFAPRVTQFEVRIILWAALISALAFLFAMALRWLAPWLKFLDFEWTNMPISFLYAATAVVALAKTYKPMLAWIYRLQWPLRWLCGLVITALVAGTAFFPADMASNSQVDVGFDERAYYWALFLAWPTAYFLYIAALTALAYRLVRKAGRDPERVARWLVIILLFEVAGFSMTSVVNAVALLGVAIMASDLLIAPSAETAPDSTRHAVTFSFVVGGIAAAIALIQNAFAADNSPAFEAYANLRIAWVPRTFAIGATAGLALALAGPHLRLGPYLKNDSPAFAKALLLSALVAVTGVASQLSSIQSRAKLIHALTAHFGLMAALILGAVIVYDLPRAKTAGGGFDWHKLLEARSIAAVAALAAAVFSAISPILINDIGTTFGTFLTSALATGN
jgi:hypothetical protein